MKRIRTQEENKAINRWSLRWCSAPTGISEQLVVCQSTFPLLTSLSPPSSSNPDACSHNYFSPQCCLLSSAHLYACLTTLFYTSYSFLQPYFPFSYQFNPSCVPVFSSSSTCAFHSLLPRRGLAWYIKAVRRHRKCHMVRKLLLPWIQWFYIFPTCTVRIAKKLHNVLEIHYGCASNKVC